MGAEYEFETLIYVPPDAKEYSVGKGVVRLDKHRCRTYSGLQNLGLTASGVLRL